MSSGSAGWGAIVGGLNSCKRLRARFILREMGTVLKKQNQDWIDDPQENEANFATVEHVFSPPLGKILSV